MEKYTGLIKTYKHQNNTQNMMWAEDATYSIITRGGGGSKNFFFIHHSAIPRKRYKRLEDVSMNIEPPQERIRNM